MISCHVTPRMTSGDVVTPLWTVDVAGSNETAHARRVVSRPPRLDRIDSGSSDEFASHLDSFRLVTCHRVSPMCHSSSEWSPTFAPSLLSSTHRSGVSCV